MAMLVIHIGLHKSGTTFLQKEVFCNLSLGFSCPKGKDALAATHEFVNREPTTFDPLLVRKRFAPLLEHADREGLVPVISDERLSSIPERGRYHLPYMLDCLSQTFGEYKLLMTIREQAAMAEALYRQIIRSGDNIDIEQFMGTGLEQEGWASRWQPSFFDYWHLYNFICRKLDSANVCVLPMELMRSAPQEYWQRLFRFCDVTGGDVSHKRHNDGLTPLATKLLRHTNGLMSRNKLGSKQPRLVRKQVELCKILGERLPATISEKISQHWREVIDARIGTQFNESNRLLGEMLELDLASLGYRVG
ncbi:sulfotransferase family protein [Teredinibacter turnerae]|uniref:sulfotransferase family protein n=1 Tax=Teredinibacter turnerae TaxID=2426 RepID=UPI00037C3F71|nr:sulfotransferase family protein [Teredinibacter turnerae]